MSIAPEDVEALRAAKRILENPGITAKLTNLVGTTLEKGLKLFPGDWRDKVGAATREALMTALKRALLTLGSCSTEANPRWHKDGSLWIIASELFIKNRWIRARTTLQIVETGVRP